MQELTLKWAFSRYPHIFFSIALASLGINMLMLTGSIYMLQIYGRVLPANSIETLIVLTILVAAMFIGLSMLDLARGKLLSRAAVRISLDLRERLARAMTQQALTSGSSVVMPVLKDFGSVVSFLGSPGIAALFDVPMSFVFFLAIYLLHPLLFDYAAISATVLFAFAVVNHLWSRGAQERAGEATSAMQGMLLSGLRNAEAMHALGMKERFLDRWKERHDPALWWEAGNRERIGTITSITKGLRLLMQSGMLGLGAWLVLRGELNAGHMIVGSILLGRALQPVEQSVMLWRGYQQYRSARGRLARILARQRSFEHQRPKTPPETRARGHLQVRNLYVAAPGMQKPWLQNIGFDLPPGKILLVTGDNGSGKSMLARALAGVWPPLSGEILLDGADIRSWPEDQFGKLIGYVPQNSQIMDGTLAENIARLGPVDEEAVQEAARQARAHESIKAFGGYDQNVGPAGSRLPGGLKQRLALARALHGEPRLLILDEPDASLDMKGRKNLADALADMKKRGQSVVLVTHDPLLQGVADMRLVLDKGKVRDLSVKKRPVRVG